MTDDDEGRAKEGKEQAGSYEAVSSGQRRMISHVKGASDHKLQGGVLGQLCRAFANLCFISSFILIPMHHDNYVLLAFTPAMAPSPTKKSKPNNSA